MRLFRCYGVFFVNKYGVYTKVALFDGTTVVLKVAVITCERLGGAILSLGRAYKPTSSVAFNKLRYVVTWASCSVDIEYFKSLKNLEGWAQHLTTFDRLG